MIVWLLTLGWFECWAGQLYRNWRKYFEFYYDFNVVFKWISSIKFKWISKIVNDRNRCPWKKRFKDYEILKYKSKQFFSLFTGINHRHVQHQANSQHQQLVWIHWARCQRRTWAINEKKIAHFSSVYILKYFISKQMKSKNKTILVQRHSLVIYDFASVFAACCFAVLFILISIINIR